MFTLACGYHTPMFDPEQVLLAVVWAVTNTVMLVKSTTTTIPADTRSDACLACGYALLGLPSAGVCPECGTPFNATQPPQRTKTRLSIDWPRARMHLLPVLFFAAALFFGRFLLWPALALGNLAEDRSLSNALWLATHRIDRGVFYGWLPIPLIMAMTPFTSWIPRWKWQAVLIAALLVLTLWWAAAVMPDVPLRWRA